MFESGVISYFWQKLKVFTVLMPGSLLKSNTLHGGIFHSNIIYCSSEND